MPTATRLFSLLLAFTGARGVADADAQEPEIRCEYARKIECTTSGCQAGVVGASYLLMPHIDTLLAETIAADSFSQLPTIRRCDAKGCSPVIVRVSLSGAFVNVTQPDGAYFLRFSTVDLGEGTRVGDFLEVASQFLTTITYFGSCKAAVS